MLFDSDPLKNFDASAIGEVQVKDGELLTVQQSQSFGDGSSRNCPIAQMAKKVNQRIPSHPFVFYDQNAQRRLLFYGHSGL
jgi:hypothetical protein